MADPYSTLGISKSATEAEVKSAYRKLAKELHPDRNKDNPKAAEKFSDVTKAYDLLSDKTKRALISWPAQRLARVDVHRHLIEEVLPVPRHARPLRRRPCRRT